MISKIRLILKGVALVIIIMLCITIAILSNRIHTLQSNLSYSTVNEKALLLKNDSNKNQIRSLQLTVEQLSYFNDSIIQKFNSAQKELKIKNKNLKELQYLSTNARAVDTVYSTDTLFVESVCLDTIIQDDWHKTNLHLCYPNEIIIDNEFDSEKIIITHLKKEPINPPKKTWIGRLFQRKHKVIVVEIEEKNPYIITKEYKHIEIIK